MLGRASTAAHIVGHLDDIYRQQKDFALKETENAEGEERG